MAIEIKRREATPEELEHWKELVAHAERHKDAMIEEGRELFAELELREAALAELRAERERQGVSLSDLMQRTGLAGSVISVLENGDKPNPTFLTLSRIAKALGVELHLGIRRPAKP